MGDPSKKKPEIYTQQAIKVTQTTQTLVSISVSVMIIGALIIGAGMIFPLFRGVSKPIEPEPEPELTTAPTYFDLAVAYTPVWYQDMDSDNYRSDMIVAFNYDGDYQGNNNFNNQGNPSYPPLANIYYYVIETDTHWFIIYNDFHSMDEQLFGSHENDLEGAMVVVDKSDDPLLPLGFPRYIETRYHNDFKKYGFFAFPSDPPEPGQPPRHARIYVGANGHAVENDPGATTPDNGNFPGGDGIIYRYTGVAGNSYLVNPHDSGNRIVTYALLSFENEFWNNRTNCCGSGNMYDGPFAYTGNRYSLPGLIPGAIDGDTGRHDIASPPWAWDESGDLPAKGDWGIDPAWTIYQHFSPSGDFSLEYTDNFYFDCDDGTKHGQCNITTNQYCDAAVLSPCPNETNCNQTSLTCEALCSDSTPFESCSDNLPQHCSMVQPPDPDVLMPRMTCVYRTGQEGGENDACELVALVSDPKPDFYSLTVDDWRRGRDPYIQVGNAGQFSGRYMCDPDQAGGQCTRDCWNITGTSGNGNGGNDGLDDIFCAAGAGCSPVSWSGCPSENPTCIGNAMAGLEAAYHKVVYYHWVADRGGSRWRNCSDDDGDQSYAIATGWKNSYCATPRCETSSPGDLLDGFNLLFGLFMFPGDLQHVSRIGNYELADDCQQCGCSGSSPYCNTDSGSCEAKCADGTLFGQCNSSDRYCSNGELLEYRCGSCGVTCQSGYDCDSGQCCRKVGGSYECKPPLRNEVDAS